MNRKRFKGFYQTKTKGYIEEINVLGAKIEKRSDNSCFFVISPQNRLIPNTINFSKVYIVYFVHAVKPVSLARKFYMVTFINV